MPRRRYRPRRSHAFLLAALLAIAAALGYHLAPSSPHPTPPPTPVAPIVSAPALPPITEYPAEPEPQGVPSPTIAPASPTHPPIVPPSSVYHPDTIPPSSAASMAGKKGLLAIVIDDMGQDVPHTREAMNTLPAAVTFAFLPYPPESPQLAEISKDKGHTILVHMPSEPLSNAADPGPDTLLAADDEDTLKNKIISNLKPLSRTAVGVNNHMGSKFTQSLPGMRTLLQILDKEGYFFLDSLTTNPTATREAAKGLAIPLLRRDVFLDHNPTEDHVKQQLNIAIRYAQMHGQAIAIGHPHPATLKVLQQGLKGLPAGITLVPVTALLP